MDELTLLADKYGTDKGSIKHNYTKHYHDILKHLRDENISLLEIGVDKGYSIKMWLEYFPKSHIVGLDINNNPIFNDNYQHVKGKQTDRNVIQNLIYKNWVYDGYDIIIDDGSHKMADILITYGALMNYCSKYYFVEDVNDKSAGSAEKHLLRQGFRNVCPGLIVKEF